MDRLLRYAVIADIVGSYVDHRAEAQRIFEGQAAEAGASHPTVATTSMSPTP